MSVINFPFYGNAIYGSSSNLPTGVPDGTTAVVLDTYSLMVYNAGTATWSDINLSGGVLTGVTSITIASGTAAAPSYNFTGDTDTGIYRVGANDIGFSTNGTLAMDISATAVTSALPVLVPSGTVGAPGFALSASSTTGIYRIGANNPGFAAAGVLVGQYSAVGNWGLGISTGSVPTADTVLTVGGNGLSTTSQAGIAVNPKFTSASTSQGTGLSVGVATAASAFTQALTLGLFLQDMVVGAGSTATRQALLYVPAPVAATNNAAIADNASFTSNWFINSTSTAPSKVGGSFIVGTAAIATNATDGFLYVPSCAGAATGTPTTRTGTVPLVFDTTNGRLYAYYGAAWKYQSVAT